MSKIKILFVLSSLKFGGSECQSIVLINTLDRKLFSVGIAYFDKVESLKPRLNDSDLFACICFDRKGKLDIATLKKLHNTISENDVDIVVCVEEYPLLYTFLSQKLYRENSFNLTTVLHQTLALPGVWRKIKQSIYKYILNRTGNIVYVSENQSNYWHNYIGVIDPLSKIIHNGVDASFFSPENNQHDSIDHLRKSLGLESQDFIVGICARLCPEKYHIDFLKGLAIAKQHGLPIKGLIIGDGPERDNIEKAAHDLELMGDIVITGFVTDVRPYIYISNVITLTSHYVETFSISALESMAMAKPLIMSNIGGASEQVKNGETGYLYESGDVKSLGHHIITLANAPHTASKMGTKAREYLLKNFTTKIMTKKYEDHFQKLYSST